MRVNGTEIFIGAYAEYQKNSTQQETATIAVSKEKIDAITAGIKEAFYSLNLQEV